MKQDPIKCFLLYELEGGYYFNEHVNNNFSPSLIMSKYKSSQKHILYLSIWLVGFALQCLSYHSHCGCFVPFCFVAHFTLLALLDPRFYIVCSSKLACTLPCFWRYCGYSFSMCAFLSFHYHRANGVKATRLSSSYLLQFP